MWRDQPDFWRYPPRSDGGVSARLGPMKTPIHLCPSLRRLYFAAALAGASLLTGCATSQPTRTGFLSDHDSLQPVAEADGLRAVKLAPWSAGRPITVAPLVWSAAPDDSAALSPEERSRLLALAGEEFAREPTLRSAEASTGAPLELRAAITRVKTSSAAANVVSTLAVFAPLDNGGVCIEWQLVDPADGRAVARGVSAQRGTPLKFASSFRKTGHAERGFRLIAAQLKAYLGVPPPV